MPLNFFSIASFKDSDSPRNKENSRREIKATTIWACEIKRLQRFSSWYADLRSFSAWYSQISEIRESNR